MNRDDDRFYIDCYVGRHPDGFPEDSFGPMSLEETLRKSRDLLERPITGISSVVISPWSDGWGIRDEKSEYRRQRGDES